MLTNTVCMPVREREKKREREKEWVCACLFVRECVCDAYKLNSIKSKLAVSVREKE